jgi:hypothetical protein
MKLIETHVMTVELQISESELRQRMARELLETANWIDPDGNPMAGVTTSIQRSRRRGEGYILRATRDMRAMPRQISHK